MSIVSVPLSTLSIPSFSFQLWSDILSGKIWLQTCDQSSELKRSSTLCYQMRSLTRVMWSEERIPLTDRFLLLATTLSEKPELWQNSNMWILSVMLACGERILHEPGFRTNRRSSESYSLVKMILLALWWAMTIAGRKNLVERPMILFRIARLNPIQLQCLPHQNQPVSSIQIR